MTTQPSKRRISFAGAALYPVVSAVAGMGFIAGVAYATNDYRITLALGVAMFTAVAAVSCISFTEYWDARRGHRAPVTRIAHNGDAVYKRLQRYVAIRLSR